MKILLTPISALMLFAHPFSLPLPKLSSPQQEIIAQFSEEIKHSSLKIALVMPKKIIGRYSIASIDTMMAYLASRGLEFEFEVFDCENEEEDSLRTIYQKIESENFQFVIGIFTTKGAYEISKIPLKTPIYIPTVNAQQINFTPSINPLLFFGGINYKDQIRELLLLNQGDRIVAYNDDSPVGNRLSIALQELAPEAQEQVITNEVAATFNKQTKIQENLLENADVFLNTPVVKTGLLLSQIGYFKKKASKFLSTQINYNPSIVILTQKRDRENFYVANSIGKSNQKLIEYGSLLNSDLKFDWVNYSTALGLEMFFRLVFPDTLPYFEEKFKDNQIQYQTKIYKIDNKGFFPIDLSTYTSPKSSSAPTQKPLEDSLKNQSQEIQQESESQESENTPLNP